MAGLQLPFDTSLNASEIRCQAFTLFGICSTGACRHKVKGKFWGARESCWQGRAKYCFQYFINSMQVYKCICTFSPSFSLSLSLSDSRRKPSSSYSYLMYHTIFIMQPLRAFKIMMCLGILNSMDKVPTVLIVADRAGCQPKEAKSMESWQVWLKEKQRGEWEHAIKS